MMSSIDTRVGVLSEDRRQVLVGKLLAKKQVPRIQPNAHPNGRAPLSYAQQRLWFLQQFDPGSAQYNLPAAVRIDGPLDAGTLEKCFSEIVRRHESLRTTFPVVAAEPVQLASPPSPFKIRVSDVHSREEAAARTEEAARTVFNLESGPLFQAELLRVSPVEHILLLNAHHIISDSWSAGILVREIVALYEAFLRGSRPSLPAPPLRYADYAAWQRDPAQESAIEAQLNYWRERLSGELPVLELRSDHPRPSVPAFRGALRKRTLPDSLAQQLRALSRREGVTLFMTLLGGFKTLLSRYTNQDDVIVGSPVSGRERAETHSLIGCFVNTLALRTNCAGDPSFADLLRRVRETCLDAWAHQEAPFERVVEAVQPNRDLSRTPVFQVAFGLRQDPVREYMLGRTRFEMLDTHTGMTKFDLMLEVIESGDRLTAAVEYNSDLFEPATIDRLLGHYETLLTAAASAPETSISLLPLMTPGEAHEIRQWNATERTYPLHLCLHEFIERQVDRTPDATALVFENERLTYRELERRVNQLAHYLRNAGVEPGTLVGVAMERSIELVVSLVAVLKAGGAYVPIDPEYPADRIAHMLEDAQPSVLLAQQRVLDVLPAYTGRVITVDAVAELLEKESGDRPALVNSPGNFAYMIFTSGSTGRPKGAINTHRGIVNRLLWMQEEYGLDATDSILQKTPFSFDVSVWEFFWPLMTGATLVVARPGGHRDAAYLARLISAEQITTLHFVPSMLQIFLEEPLIAGCQSLRRVICSGEALPFELEQRFFTRISAELHNLYGPTEAAVDVTSWKCRPGSSLQTVPIGRPIANTQIHLLDARMNPVPVGVAGELYIGGVNVGLGYLNRAELTAEKFIADPFRDDPDARLYRTGDLARYLPDGAIDYLGRMDHQVKIRGFRIELGEIEAVLNQHPAVRESVVVALTHASGEKRLAAYVVQSGSEALDAAKLGEHLRASLPDYMVPATFTVMDRLPISPNGKVDRRALPAPDPNACGSGATREFEAPRTPTEELLAQLWCGALGLERVGRNDDFFHLGGHSLLAAQLASRIRTVMGVDLPVRRIFERSKLQALAAGIDATVRNDAAPAIKRRASGNEAQLSFSQQRLWILDQLTPGDFVYHLPLALKIEGTLDYEALNSSFEWMINRHESLRTCFPVRDGVPIQVISAMSPARIERLDLSALLAEKRDAALKGALLEQIRQPFDLARGPLMRGLVVRLSDSENVLSIVAHHIVSDGWSLNILLRELTGAYAAFASRACPNFAPLPVQYADYSAWQREWLEGAVFNSQMDYWRRQLDRLPMLNLPTDRPRPGMQSFKGARRSAHCSAALSEQLRRLARQQNSTMFMVLLAGFQVLLARYTGQTDIAAGTPIANRNHAEIEGLIGFFVNTLVLRTRLDGDPSFNEILSRVREVCLGAYANQDLPFERLVEELRPERHLGLNPLFQVMFTVRDGGAAAVDMAGATANVMDPPEGISKFDLTMEIELGQAGFRIGVEYDTALFDAATIDSLLLNFETLLDAAAASPNTTLSQLPVVSEPERRLMLTEWNDTQTVYPRNASIPALFDECASQTPHAVALEFGETRWTWEGLDRRSNQIANRLRNAGLTSGRSVGLCMQRSASMIAATLGILKAGCAYVPLDATYPAERLRLMLEDSSVDVVVAEPAVSALLQQSASECRIVSVDETWNESASESDAGLDVNVRAEDPAYVMFTSGSTGKPKGIVVPHRAIVRLVRNTNYVQLDGSERIAQVSNISFDAATFEIWGALLNGGCLVGIDKETALIPASLAATVKEQRITTMFLTTALFNQMAREAPDAFHSLNNLFFGGEAADASAIRRVLSAGRPARLMNVYGPTETTTYASWHLIDQLPEDATTVPIGRPIANTTFYVLDPNRQPVPCGVPGELYIGGDGVAIGYLSRPELTSEKFVANPFVPGSEHRLYRTGDLVRYRRDGAVEFLGRLDDQIKIRGFRIEPGEIDAALARHPFLHQTLTIVREDTPGEKRLVSYCVPAGSDAPDSTDLRRFLAGHLPEYMLPGAFVILEALPINVNGKVDRSLLPAPGAHRGDLSEHFVAPRNPMESALCAIWTEVLGVTEISVDDNFFAIGGHSLLATQVVSRIRSVHGIEMPLRTLFEHQTIADLAVHLSSQGSAGDRPEQILPRRNRGNSAPLSWSQQRLWFLDQLMPGTALYNLPAMVRFKGDLNVAVLEQALSAVVDRHEALRTTFELKDGSPAQLAGAPRGLAVSFVDLRGLDAAGRESEARRLAAEEARRPFDLATGPLTRASLIQIDTAEHVLLLTMHHIVCDGWSIGILIREAAQVYQCVVRGEEMNLPPMPLQYSDYAIWQRESLSKHISDSSLAWWKSQLSGELPVLELPTDRPRTANPSLNGSRYRAVIDPALLQRLKSVAEQNDATLFMVLLAAFNTLLSLYSGQEDIIVGSPIAGRTRTELEGLIGFFVNTLPLRTDLSGDPTLSELVRRVRETTIGAYANQDVPFEMLVDAIAPGRTSSQNPLFQVALVLQNGTNLTLELPGLKVDVEETDSGYSKFDLTLVAHETNTGLSTSYEYRADLFEEATVARMAAHLGTLLEAIAANPERRLSELPLMNETEQRTLVEDWNRTEAPYPPNRCLDALLVDQVERTPEAVALMFEGHSVTYAELNARASLVAAALQRRGVGPETLAAIALDRSPEMIVAILSVLKAGGAWLPLAVDQPADRISFLLSDASPKVVISSAGSLSRLPQALEMDVLDLHDLERENNSGAAVASKATPSNLAYVIYTSGSTGRPKGVLVEHGGAVNLALAQGKLFGVTAGTCVLQFAAPTFDAAVSEIFVTLLNGGMLLLARREQLVGTDLAELLRAGKVNVVTLPPSVLATLPETDLPALRTLVVAGEACPAELARRWSAGRRMINAYGPTEATVCATAGECDGRERITIGRPIDNVRVYIVDQKLRPVPAGVPGELVIGGAGVARGYLAQPELTAERFVADPFRREQGSRLYRTGDRGRYLVDGRIEYLGRMDRQVKIRGFRIEPGEIEAALLQMDPVREAVVTVDASAGHKRLVAYVTPQNGAIIDTGELRSALARTLPEYMIPSAFVVMDALPLTAHGKIDIAALPAPNTDRPGVEKSDAAPRSEVEKTLATIWQQVLGVANIGVQDNFFELGGDSILTIQIIARAHAAGLYLTPRDLFDHQTIATLATVARNASIIQCEQGPVTGPVLLTPIQHWFFEQELADAHHWNQSVLLTLAESPDVNALKQALAALLEHHDALRARFSRTPSSWNQNIAAPDSEAHLTLIDLSQETPSDRAAQMERLASDTQASIDLANGPLLRAVVFNLGDQGWRLLLVVHHLSVDGVSWRILLEDLHAAYNATRAGKTVQLPPKTTSWREWAEKLAASANSPETRNEADYWLSIARASRNPLPVDTCAEPSANTRESAGSATIGLTENETTQLLRDVPKAYRTRINDALLAALARAFRRWTGGDSLVIDLESHGRDALSAGVDVSRTVGWFTSSYPICLTLPPATDPGASLTAVKEQLRRIPRDGAGYGVLRYLGSGDVARELAVPAPEVSFNYLGQFDQSFEQASLFSPANESRGQELSPRGQRRNLLEFNGNVLGGQLHFTCVYSRVIHSRETVGKLLDYFAEELRAIVAHCVAPDVGGFTPSDFPLARLDDEKLGKLARLISKPAQGRSVTA